MNTQHNCLIIKSRPTDYILGSSSPIKYKSNLPSGDWTGYLDYFELQKIGGFETNGCVLFTIQESFDAQMDFLISNGTFPQSLVQQLAAMGYMDLGRDGLPHFHSSARYLQIKTGNGFNGNAIQDGWDALRKFGTLPWKDLPFDSTVTQGNYLNPTTPTQDAKALQFLNLIGGKQAIQYHWVINNGRKNLTSMEVALTQAPLCLGVAVTDFWNQVTPGDPTPDAAPAHCVMNYQIQAPNCNIEDHYIPYLKSLDATYPVNFVMQGVVIPILQIATVAINETEQIANEIEMSPASPSIKAQLYAALAKVAIALANFLGFHD